MGRKEAVFPLLGLAGPHPFSFSLSSPSAGSSSILKGIGVGGEGLQPPSEVPKKQLSKCHVLKSEGRLDKGHTW
jgi:hypothetical protein